LKPRSALIRLVLLVLLVAVTVEPIQIRAQGQGQVPVGVRINRGSEFYAVAVYGDYVYVAGRELSSSSPYIVKFDRDYNVVWAVRIYKNTYAYDIDIGLDGNIYVTGDTFLAKLDQDGNLKWYRTLSIAGKSVFGYGVVAAPDGSVYVAGDNYIAKFDSNGNLLWAKAIHSDGCYVYFVPWDVATTRDGSVYVVGYIWCYSSNSYDAFVAKLDSNGNLAWFRLIGGSGHEFATSVAVGPDGSIYVVGYTYSFGTGVADIFVAKLDQGGNLVRFKTIGGSNDDFGNAVAVGADGSVYVVVNSNSFSDSYANYVAKLDQSGKLVWFRRPVANFYGIGNNIEVMPYGCPIYVGTYMRYGAVAWGYTDEVDPSQVSVNDYTNSGVVKSPRASTPDITDFSALPGNPNVLRDNPSVQPIYGAGLLEQTCPIFSVQPQPQQSADSAQTGRSLGGAAEPFEYWLVVVPVAATIVVAVAVTRRRT